VNAQGFRRRKVVIGVGNEARGDDAVGLWAARRLRERNIPGITAYELTGEPTQLFDVWKNAGEVCLIDAIYSGAEPGTLHRFEGGAHLHEGASFRLSTHGAGIASAIELGRALGLLPARLLIYAIEGRNYAPGQAISPEVLKAAEKALEAIVKELRGSDCRPHHA